MAGSMMGMGRAAPFVPLGFDKEARQRCGTAPGREGGVDGQHRPVGERPCIARNRVRARAGVGAGAVHAPDCAREPQGALRLCVKSGSFRAGTARGKAVRADFASLGPILSHFSVDQVLIRDYF